MSSLPTQSSNTLLGTNILFILHVIHIQVHVCIGTLRAKRLRLISAPSILVFLSEFAVSAPLSFPTPHTHNVMLHTVHCIRTCQINKREFPIQFPSLPAHNTHSERERVNIT